MIDAPLDSSQANERGRCKLVCSVTGVVVALVLTLAQPYSPAFAAGADELVVCESSPAEPTRLPLSLGQRGSIGNLAIAVHRPRLTQRGEREVFSFVVENSESKPMVVAGRLRWELWFGSTAVSPVEGPETLSLTTIPPRQSRKGSVVFPVVGMTRRAILSVRLIGDAGEEGSLDWELSLPEGSGGGVPEGSAFVVPGGEVVRSYEIDVVVERDASATFRERLVYDFGDNLRRGIYREFVTRVRCNSRYDRIWPLDVLSVFSPDAPDDWVVESSDNTKLLRIGDPDRYIDGRHSYSISVRMRGVVNAFENHEEFFWNVVGHEWTVPISNVRVTVTGPEAPIKATCFAGPFGSRSSCDTSSISGMKAIFGESVLAPGSGLSVGVMWPKGTFSRTKPLLDERWSLRRAFSVNLVTVGLTLASCLATVAGWSIFAYKTGRDRVAVGSPTDVAFASNDAASVPVPLFADDDAPVEFAPPDDIRPAQMGLLMYERVRPVDVAATLVDLAVRRYLTISEISSSKRSDYLFEKGERFETAEDSLLAYEKKLLEAVFESGSARPKLSDLRSRFHSFFLMVCELIYEDGVQRGWFAGRPDRVRAKWQLVGAAAVVAGIGTTIALAAYTHLGLLGIPPLLLGVLILMSAPRLPRRTPSGVGLLRRCSGFESFIVDSEAARARWAEQKNLFSEYLPYAIVLGESEKWAKTFEGLGPDGLGDVGWYRSDGRFSALVLASEMRSFSTRAGSWLSEPPSGHGQLSKGYSRSVLSGGGWGRSSFGGGGFSGGGGGGGGGGSW